MGTNVVCPARRRRILRDGRRRWRWENPRCWRRELRRPHASRLALELGPCRWQGDIEISEGQAESGWRRRWWRGRAGFGWKRQPRRR
eukprot:1491112-Alexandrium_andersonii.AAC.1